VTRTENGENPETEICTIPYELGMDTSEFGILQLQGEQK